MTPSEQSAPMKPDPLEAAAKALERAFEHSFDASDDFSTLARAAITAYLDAVGVEELGLAIDREFVFQLGVQTHFGPAERTNVAGAAIIALKRLLENSTSEN